MKRAEFVNGSHDELNLEIKEFIICIFRCFKLPHFSVALCDTCYEPSAH